MQKPSLELQIQTLPDGPGVYQYYDAAGKILYVGKAKNLKKRVSSYFHKTHDNAKTNVLVRKIVSIKHIVVPNKHLRSSFLAMDGVRVAVDFIIGTANGIADGAQDALFEARKVPAMRRHENETGVLGR